MLKRSRPTRRSRSRLGVIGAVCLVALLAATACSPIEPDNRPSTVPGAQNGNLSPSLLRIASPGCTVFAGAAASYGSMIAAAKADGVQLEGLDCYRDYAGQVAARDRWCGLGACQMAAVPGSSNHGWGKAVDFRDQSGEITFNSAGYQWMKARAGIYGWNHPGSMEADGATPEPWHWEWVGDGGSKYPNKPFGIGSAASFPADGNPVGTVDTAQGSVSGPSTINVRGWSIDPDTTLATNVDIYVDDAFKGSLQAQVSRPDVTAAYPAWGTNHGYEVAVPTTPGTHEICVWGMNRAGSGVNTRYGCRTTTSA